MEEESTILVPDNSFVDDADLWLSEQRKTQLSLTTTSGRGLGSRKSTVPQSLQSNTYDLSSSPKSFQLPSKLVSPERSSNASSGAARNMEMLRSANGTLHQLKSRLYNRPSQSEVFMAINRTSKNHTGKKSLPHPPTSVSPVKTPYKTMILRKKQIKHEENEKMLAKEQQEIQSTQLDSTMMKGENASVESGSKKNDSSEVLWLIYDLRKRLGWPYKGIELGEKPIAKKTIDTTIDELADDGQFKYCLERGHDQPTARYNPYDLVVATAIVIKNCKKYYTVSATYVTMVQKNQEPVTTPVLDWLAERKRFLSIFNIPFFAKYRLRRTFLTWKHNIRSSRNSEHKSCLGDSLLMANTIFQKALLQVRSLCENACSSGSGLAVESEAICLVDTDWYLTMTLDDFCERQRLKVIDACQKLVVLQKRVVQIVSSACKEIVEIEKIRIDIKIEEKLTSRASRNIIHKDAKAKSMERTKQKYGLIDDKENMLKRKEDSEKKKTLYKYTKQAEWRTVHRRLRSFVRCVDFLIMELLTRVVSLAVSDIASQIQTSINMNEKPKPREINWPEVKRNANRDTSDILKAPPKIVPPMFELNLVLEDRKNSAKRISAKRRGVSRMTRRGVHFSPVNEHEEQEEEGQSSSSEEEDFNDAANDEIDREYSKLSISASVDSIINAIVQVSPSYQEIESRLLDVIYEYEQSILTFTSLLKEPAIQEYIDESDTYLVLECDKEALELSKAHEPPWPSIEHLFGADDDYQGCISDIVQFVSAEIRNVEGYSKGFVKFCGMVDQASRINVERSLERKEWTSEQFNVVLSQVTEQISAMKAMNEEMRVGMFVVKSVAFRDTCLPFPQRIFSSISVKLPRISCARNEALLKTIKTAEIKLAKSLTAVEEFVEHLAFLARLAIDMPALEKEYKIVSGLFQVAIKFSLDFSAEEWALYRTLGPSFSQLKSAILYCEAKKDERIEIFMKDLKDIVLKLSKYLQKVKNSVRSSVLLDDDVAPQAALENIQLLMEDVDIIGQRARNYASYQDRFGDSLSTAVKKRSLRLGESQFEPGGGNVSSVAALQKDLSEIERDLTLRKLLWESMNEWEFLIGKWKSTQFDALAVDAVQNDVTRFVQTVFLLEKGLPPNPVVPHLKQKVTNFKQGMPVISSLRNTALKERHWNEIQAIIGTKVVNDKSFTLGNLLQLKIFQYKDRIAEISSHASNEATVEQMLQRVMAYWSTTDFQLVAHSSRDTAIIVGSDEIAIAIEESQVTINNIKGSRFSLPIKGLVDEWERKLNLFSQTFEEWMIVQRSWLYLETIFSAADIQRQLANESKLFNVVDKNLKDIMRRVSDNPNAIKAATSAGVLEVLRSCSTNLEKIQRSLEDYLETKRLVFARFYFLSNEELLDILSNSKNPSAVQPHLKKCFGNVKSLVLLTETKALPTVLGMLSEEEENLPLAKAVRATGPVEHWLLNVEHTMFDTVKFNLKKAIADYDQNDYINWVLSHSGQVVIAVTQIMFSRKISKALTNENSNSLLNDSKDELIALLHRLASVVIRALPPHQYQLVVALIIMLVHSRDIVQNLVYDRVESVDDFAWTRHLRYDWDDDGNTCILTQSLASFVYGYEYLGCSSRLVITPLTDRCYLTLTGAMHFNLGGAPAGPAGTGKTETVKDLAKAMGKQCLVFNCSEGLDFKMIGKILSGLAQSGSWCCFDEFNRIDIEVLSVVAQQLHSIKVAKDTSAVRLLFEGRDIKLNPSCGAFITMNPGYAGRVDLPDNLKSLFRPVAMVVPDYSLIAEIILFSQGFEDAASLSRKLVNLYELASKQLSQQDHYDFGLRAIKAVLVMAGQKRRATSLEKSSVILLKEDEMHVLINAIKNANLPKFISDDVGLFERILADIFPDTDVPPTEHAALEKAIGTVLRELSYQRWPSQIEKVIQFNDTLQVRHGVMLVGPTGGGKSTVRKILRKALTVMPGFLSVEDDTATIEGGDETASVTTYQPSLVNVSKKGTVDLFSINPKCISLGELYGEIDANTMEWSDGLLAAAVRMFSKQANAVENEMANTNASPDVTSRSSSRMSKASTDPDLESLDQEQKVRQIINWQWVVLDGPVDTLWIENLNTVLDDTKVLCLANGERIPMNPSMRMIFEVDSLSQASPATISRCGMVYLDPRDLGWKPYVRSWLNKLREKKVPEAGRDHLFELFEATIDHGLRFVQEHQSFISIVAPPLSIISTLCAILDALIDHLWKQGGFGEVQEDEVDNSGAVPVTPDLISRSPVSPGLSMSSASSRKQNFLEKNPSQLPQFFSKLYVFAYIWAFGGNLNCPSEETIADVENSSQSNQSFSKDSYNARISFDSFVRELFESNSSLDIRLPTGSTSLYNYYVDLDKGQFVTWENLVPSTEALIEKFVANQIAISDTVNVLDDPMPNLHEIETRSLIPTLDSVQYSFIVGLLALNNTPILLTGDTGVGKSALLNDVLNRLSQEGGAGVSPGTILGSVLSSGSSSLLESIVETSSGKDRCRRKTIFVSQMQFSAHTSVFRTRKLIESKLVKRGRDALGAKLGKKVLVFVDDVNMPQPEAFGAQPPLELLRSFLDSGGFYESTKLHWKEVYDVNLLCACAPPSGGRHVVSPRLLRNLSVFCLPPPSTSSLQHIYGTILGRFQKSRDFSVEVKLLRNDIVSTVISIYQGIKIYLRPTPSKCHYLFNLRDVSKVIHGLLQAHPSTTKSCEHWLELTCHESARVFYDRLTDEKDRSLFCDVAAHALKDNFKAKWTPNKFGPNALIFGDFLDLNAGEYERTYKCVRDPAQLLQVLEDYRDRASISGRTMNQSLVLFSQAIRHISRVARVFRQREGHMLLIGIGGSGKSSVAELAAYIELCSFIKPSLKRIYTHSDFREDVKNVCLMAGIKNQKTVLYLSDALIVKEVFLEDVCNLLNLSQAQDIFDEEDKERISLELKKDAVEQGIQESKEQIFQFFLSRVRSRLHLVFSTSPSGSLFRHRCRTYPSLVQCCTIDWYDEWREDALRSVAKAHLEELIEDEGKATHFYFAVSDACVLIHKSIESASNLYLQELNRHFYVTPRSYIEFIKLYNSLLKEKKAEYNFSLTRMSSGLRKVAEAKELVAVMQEELIKLGPILEQRSKDTENLMVQLEQERQAVDTVRSVVQREEDITDKEAKRVEAVAESARKDLEQALPQLQLSIEMLDALNKNDIVEVRAYSKPPTMVMTVMAAVCTLLGQKTDWSTAKHLLGEQGFLKRLVAYDRDSVTNRIYDRVKKITKNPDFNPTAIGKISKACKSMCAWVLALQNYTEVHRMVLPKQQRCEEAQEALSVAFENLRQKRVALRKVQDQLDSLQSQYDSSFAELEFLKNKKEQSIVRLRRAAILTKSLADEEIRWRDSVEKLQKNSQGLIGNTLLAAASVAYTGAFTYVYRKNLFQQWLKSCDDLRIPLSENYDIVDYLTEPIRVQDWKNRGLPHDRISVENAIFVTNTHRWPYIIDPQSQAIKWVYEVEDGNSLKVVKASDVNFMKVLEPALRLGKPVIIEDATETLDPALVPILNMNVKSEGGSSTIKIGDTEVEYDPKFRLYIITQIANPHLLPETCIKVCVINFTVTFEGLQDQLLSNVVHQERPDLEVQRYVLLENLVDDKMKLREIEDRTLDLLNTSIGNVLDDEDLINTLDNSKDMVSIIEKRLEDTQDTQKNIQRSRTVYSTVAERGAVLYFVLNDLSLVDVMYQFSLNWFISLFSNCISTFDAPSPEELPTEPALPKIQSGSSSRKVTSIQKARTFAARRQPKPRQLDVQRNQSMGSGLQRYLQTMIDLLTETVYRVVSQALFARHQRFFSFYLCVRIHMQGRALGISLIESADWQCFLYGTGTKLFGSGYDSDLSPRKEKRSVKPEPARGSMGQVMEKMMRSPARWISQETWQECLQISEMIPSFSGICSHISSNPQFWLNFNNSNEPFTFLSQVDTIETEKETSVSQEWSWSLKKMTDFQKLLLIKILKNEYLISSIREYVISQMGVKFITPTGFDLHEFYDGSNCRTPLIFILSPGSDPTSELLRFAKDIRGSTLHLDMISLGRGQGPKAEELIRKAYSQKGKWVFLQNCHLAGSFMPKLREIVRSICNPDVEVDPHFRLWLSSKPNSSFPMAILQTGLKMTVEPPPGLKANLQRSFFNISGILAEKTDKASLESTEWKRLLFGLCTFHAVVQERRKFGPLGWNVPYEFINSDLEVSVLSFYDLITSKHEIPWKALKLLTGEIIYGGRVTDNWDQICLLSLLEAFLSEDILEKDFRYLNLESFKPPGDNFKLDDVNSYIETFPSVDPPEVFGMHPNAEMEHLKNGSRKIVETLIMMRPRTELVVGQGRSNDDIVVDTISQICRILPSEVQNPILSRSTSVDSRQYLRSPSRSSLAQKSSYKSAETNSMTLEESNKSAMVAFLRQEHLRYDKLLGTIHRSLQALYSAVSGEIVMSEVLEETYSALLQHCVPHEWKIIAYSSTKPLASWIDNLIKRIEFIAKWIEIVKARERVVSQQQSRGMSVANILHSPAQNPRSFWLPAFYFPQGFLTAVLQSYARKKKIAIDSLCYDYKVSSHWWCSPDTSSDKWIDIGAMFSQTDDAPEDGIIVTGLFLDGARWNVIEDSLEESATSQRFSPLPELHFLPIMLEDSSTNEKFGMRDYCYECPLYQTSSRASSLTSSRHTTNFISSVKLNTRPAICVNKENFALFTSTNNFREMAQIHAQQVIDVVVQLCRDLLALEISVYNTAQKCKECASNYFMHRSGMGQYHRPYGVDGPFRRS